MGLAVALFRLLRHIMVRSETFKLVIVVILGFLLISWIRRTLRSRLVPRNGGDGKPNSYLLGQATEGGEGFTQSASGSEGISWELKEGNVAVYAIQGKRMYMEDRYDFVDDTNKTGYSVYGVFDGHGGQFASEYVRKVLSHALLTRLAAPADNGGHNLTKILYEEILSTDKDVVNVGKSNNNLAGTTALVGLLSQGGLLTVANVGDSRGVICDAQGRAVPLSTDHKPNHLKERKRIKKAGGFVSFNGVWRVAGILATSRALGDYPLKERHLVVADPDVTTFDLGRLRPQFMILATDGLWDAFSNEEAVAYIRERLDEPHFGAKSLVLQAYYRGSPDNITVMVVNFQQAHFTGDQEDPSSKKRKSL